MLDHFDQPPKFFTCNKCDNCCEKELKDITSIIWPIVYKEEIPTPHFNKNEIEFLKKNIKNPKFNKINNVFMELNLNTWKKYVDKKKYKYNDLPENLKIKIYYQDLLERCVF